MCPELAIDILLLAVQARIVFSLNINENLFGVFFTPYIKVAPWNTYKFENVETMMEIVSTKFKRVFTLSVDAHNVPYIKNHSYYYDANIRARTAEAAALINRKNNKKSLSVMIGVWNSDDWSDSVRWNTEINVAVEAAQIANSIYPGTVDGIILTKYDIYSEKWAKSTLRWIEKLRSMTAGLGLKIGSEQFCRELYPSEYKHADNYSIELWSLRKEIALKSDIVVCESIPINKNLLHGARYSFARMRSSVIADLNGMKGMKPGLDVLYSTYWPAAENDSWNTVENFGDYWDEVNQIANEKRFQVYLRWAFGFPGSFGYRGWWKLRNNSLINNPAGYVETISGKPVDVKSIKPRQTNSLESGFDFLLLTVILIVVCAVVVFIVILGLFYWRRKHTKPKFLTRRDIQEFKLGIPNLHGNHEHVDNVPAFNAPYDNALEIPKSKLTILWDKPLGGGNFGFVCKGILRNGNDQHIALKMAKQDRVTIALKGILSEIKILVYLGQHPNIVSICGAYTGELAQGVLYLALELCELGSLKDYLRTARNPKRTDKLTEPDSVQTNYDTIVHNAIQISDLFRWSYEIACGMEHLEKKNVIHADLAIRNILLTSEKTAKITDFGLSRRLYEYSNYSKQSQEPLPWRWMAFESLKRTEFSVKSDVWSYGVTLWEIFSLGDLPFPGHSWSQDFIEAVENGLRLSQPRNASDEMYQEMRNCWQLLPEDRPKFAELRNKIKLLYEETTHNLL